MFKNFIWDFDGTLVETYSQIFACYEKVLKYYDKSVDINIIKEIFREHSGKEAIEYIEAQTGIAYNDFLNKYSEFSSDIEIIKTAHIYEGTKELLMTIKDRGYKNYIVTNRNSTIFDYLKVLGIEDYFEDVLHIGRYDITERKPSTVGYEYIIKKHNLDLGETLSIGDTDLDIYTSQKVNLKTCLIRPIENYSSKPDYVVKDAAELMKLIQL